MTNKSTNYFPIQNKTITWAAASNSQVVQFDAAFPNSSPSIYPSSLEINNATSVGMFVAWDTATLSATSSGYYVGPGSVKVIEIGSLNQFVAVIPVGTVTGSVYMSKGRGA